MANDFALFFLRVFPAGIMMIAHGVPKLLNFSAKSQTFADPLGIGSVASLALVVGAEVFCSIALILGFYTRLASWPLMIMMAVSAFIHFQADPWSKKELPVIYGIVFIAIALLGPGRFSIDGYRKAKS